MILRVIYTFDDVVVKPPKYFIWESFKRMLIYIRIFSLRPYELDTSAKDEIIVRIIIRRIVVHIRGPKSPCFGFASGYFVWMVVFHVSNVVGRRIRPATECSGPFPTALKRPMVAGFQNRYC